MGDKKRAEVCVYKVNPGLYSRVFSSSGTAWSSACGKGCPYYMTHEPLEGARCHNCHRPIKLEHGVFKYDKDWEEYQGHKVTADIADRIKKAAERGWAIERIELTHQDIIDVTCEHPDNVKPGLRLYGKPVVLGEKRGLVLKPDLDSQKDPT